MIKLHCRTNLDLDNREKWPEQMPEIPRVGDIIQSNHRHTYNGSSVALELVVVRVKWVPKTIGPNVIEYRPEVELHLIPSRYSTITDFYAWYGRITGRGTSAFI